MFIVMYPSFDTLATVGSNFYDKVQQIADTYQSERAPYSSNFSIHFFGLALESLDATNTMYDMFPKMVAMTAGAVLLIVGLAFRSVGVPVRSVFSIAFTEIFVFGAVVCVYQSPAALQWTTWESLHATGAISFTVPIVSFGIILGIALDYDIFLLTRVWESMEKEKLTTFEGVVRGLCRTGKVITAAGVIMAIAFFGLLLSPLGALNELGFYLCVAVLFDTFVVRTLLVPSLISLMGKYSWWPRSAN